MVLDCNHFVDDLILPGSSDVLDPVDYGNMFAVDAKTVRISIQNTIWCKLLSHAFFQDIEFRFWQLVI